MSEAAAKPVKEHCNVCLGWKNHNIAHSERTEWYEEIDDDQGVHISGGDIWDLMRCLGCDHMRLKHRSWFSEATDERGNPAVTTEFFPPSIARQKLNGGGSFSLTTPISILTMAFVTRFMVPCDGRLPIGHDGNQGFGRTPDDRSSW